MPDHRSRAFTVAAVAAVALGACTGSHTADDAATSSLPLDPPSTSATVEPERATSATVSVDIDATRTDPNTSPSSSSTDVVTVSASAIPAEVADAVRSNGGELADTADWTDRFGPVAMPIIDGAGVALVEATLTATATSSGWERTDELQWLFTSATARNDLLDQMAFAAGIAHAAGSTEASTIDTADCVVRHYTTSDADWQVQGCSFPQFSNLASIGVSRTATTPGDDQLAGLDPSIANVVDDLDAPISAIDIAFAAPAPGSSTTLTATVEVATTDPDPARTLAEGALATWATENGEAGLVSFTGAPGSHWNVTAGVARFTHEGRLAP